MLSPHWKYERATKTIRATPSNHWIATMDSFDGAVDNEANARLIACAPEMAEVLMEAINAFARVGTGEIRRGDCTPVWEKMVKVVSKAKGFDVA